MDSRDNMDSQNSTDSQNKIHNHESLIKLTKIAEIHNLVYDENQIKQFAKLIDLEHNTHHIHIIARPKYNKIVKFKTHYMSPRTICNLTPEKFVNYVKKYEMPVGYYTDSDGTICPPDSLVIYCTTNPRCNKKAAKKFIHETIDALVSSDDAMLNNINGRMNSCIMSSKEKTNLITMDIDDKKDLAEVLDFLKQNNICPVANIETRGGYHLLLSDNNVEVVYKKYRNKHTMGDISCAVPGTYQGGFPVKFVSLE
jgi:hypothetical protein